MTEGEGSSGEPPEQNATGTDGAIGRGFVEGGDEGVDETGSPQFQGCLYGEGELPGAAAFVHQCDAEIVLSMEFKFDPFVGGTQTIDGGGAPVIVETLLDSTYAAPLASACCSDIEDWPGWTPGEDTCGTERHKASYSDVAQLICGILPKWLEKQAVGKSASGGKAISKAAAHYKNNINECYMHLWHGADALHDADYCGPAFSGQYFHPAFEPTNTFTHTDC